MTTAARVGFGVTLERETAVANTYDALGELVSLGEYNMTRETLDVTTHDSAGGFKDYIPGAFIDVADITAEINFLGNTEQETLRTDLETSLKKNWRITFPTNPVKTLTFAAYVTGYTVATEIGSAMKATITLKPTSQPTWT